MNLVFLLGACANRLLDSFPYKNMSCLWSLIWWNPIWGSWYLITWLGITVQFCNGVLGSYFFKLTLGSDLLWKQVPRGFYVKEAFFKILQNLQENTCARVSFLINLQAWGLWNKIILINFENSSSFMMLKAIFSLMWYSPLTFLSLQNALYLLILTCLEKFCQFSFLWTNIC